MSRAPLGIFAVALALAGLSSAPGRADGERVGQLLRLKRGVQAKPPGGEIPAPHDVFQGMEVWTPKQVTAVIRVDPTPPLRGVVRLGPESHVKFTDWVVDVASGKLKKVGLWFQIGHFRAAFTTSGDAVARPGEADWVDKEIGTPTTDILLTGTLVDVQVAKDGTTSVLVIEGSATVTAKIKDQARRSVKLSAGTRTTVRPDQPPTPPAPDNPNGDTLGPQGGGFQDPRPVGPDPPFPPRPPLDLPRLDRP